MKKIKFTCTNCDAKLRVPTHLAGVSAPCPKCGATITAPSDITQAVDDEPRRAPVGSGTAPVSSSGGYQEPSRSRETAYAPSRSESATALAEPPVTRTGKSDKAAPAAKLESAPAAKPGPAPAPASLPQTTGSVVIPTPVTRPLQPRPLTPPESPAPPEPAPSFFSPPPPPVLPSAPEAAEPGPQSEAPLSLPPTNPVVVEVSHFPASAPAPVPPASVITKPIQVHSRPSDLPDLRSEISGSDSLPRLDVSLAGPDAGAAGGTLPGEHTGQPARTRLQLPQPGVETQKFNPNDFIVPATAPQETPPALQDAGGEAPPDLDLFDPADIADVVGEADSAHYVNTPIPGDSDPIPLDDLDDMSFDDHFDAGGNEEVPPQLSESDPDEADEYFSDLSGEEEIPPGLEAPAWSEEELAGEPVSTGPVEVPWNLQPGSVPDDVESRATQAPAPMEGAAPALKSADDDFDFDEVPVNSLQEGNFGKLFSQSSARPAGDPAPAAENPPAMPPAAEQPTALPAAPAAQTPPAGPQGDVLHELFGESSAPREDSKKLSKTAVVMISCLIGAAAIAVLMVAFLWQFGGGLNPADSYKEGSLVEGAEEKRKAENPTDSDSSSPAGVGTPSGEIPAVIDPVAIMRESSGDSSAVGSDSQGRPAPTETPEDTPALSIDERVQRIVNGTGGAPSTGGSVIGQPSLDLDIGKGSTPPIPVGTAAPATAPAPAATTSAAEPASDPSSAPAAPDSAGESSPAMTGPAGEASSGTAARALADTGKSANYNPPATFAAPGPNDSPLLRTNDLIDAFLRAPDWETRIKYTYQGDSLRPAIEDYYKKWPDTNIERYYLQLFQMEPSIELGGPYWVYLVSTSDADQGFPLILRVEDGNLKVDWEIYSEFYDRHFVRFREGAMSRPSTFRVVIERVSEYYGPDREAFTDQDDYFVYQINPPYGDLNEFSEYAFVDKDSEIAKKLESVVGLGEEPLAVIVTLDEKPFNHGVKHLVITEYLTEGWFR